MFSLDDTLYEIIDKYPEALDFFIANGFEQLKNKQMLEVMGKNIKLKTALMSKKINQELFVEKLETFLQKDADVDVSLDESKADENSDLIIEGVLPCPFRRYKRLGKRTEREKRLYYFIYLKISKFRA